MNLIKYYILTINIFITKCILKYYKFKETIKNKYLESYIKYMVWESYNYNINAFISLYCNDKKINN